MNNERIYAMLSCQLSITGILMKKPSKHFKIGKTAQDPPERRVNARYENDYNHFIPIYCSADLSLIDELEVELITYYKRCYNASCDNEYPQIGPKLKGPNIGYIYLVIE